MIAARLLCGGRRLRHVEAADEDDALPKRLERLRDERELEVLSLLERTPVTGRGAVRVPDAHEAPGRCRGRESQGCQSGHHRLKERQGQRHASAAQKHPTRDVLLAYV